MEYTYKNLFKYFIKFFRPYWVPFSIGTAMRVLSAIFWLYNAYAFSEVVSFLAKYQSGDSLDRLYVIFITWLFISQARYILIYWSKRFCINSGEKAAADVDAAALRHLSNLDISWHEKEGAGNKVKRIQKGGDGVATLARVWVVNIVDIIVGFIGMIYIISIFDSLLALLVFIYQIIYFSISTFFRRRTVKTNREKNIIDEEYTGLMFEMVNNIRSVKVLGMGDSLLEYVRNISRNLVEKTRVTLFWYHGQILARMSWEGLAKILLYVFVIYGITQGHYEVGFFVLFHGYFGNLSTSVNDLSSVAQDVAIAKSDIGRLSDIFSQPITIEDDTNKVSFPADWDGIHIRNLSFTYGQNLVLSEINFDIKKGEKVGIVGLSGAGKSTLFKLLLKEHENQGGDILIGEVPLKKIKRSSYIEHVAAVLQETEVFNMSLRKNIQLANAKASGDEKIFQRALNISHVNNFIHKLPQGVDTVVGEKGVRLSGGEKQRLGIARAVFKNPEILFLDEATSHLDVESEQKIQDSLSHFFKDVTAVVIAHRLSTIKEMDRIIVIENGKIIEVGTFDELYKSDGRFREFWDKQKI